MERKETKRLKIDMRWQRIRVKFPEIFLPGTLRGNAVEFVAIKYKTRWCAIGRDGIPCEAG